MCDVGLGRESHFGSLLVNLMEQVKGMRCMGRRGGEMGDGGYGLGLFLRID